MSTDATTTPHPRQPELDGQIEGPWLAAIADAAILPSEAILYPFPGSCSSVECFSAVTWRRGRVEPILPAFVRRAGQHRGQ